MAVVAVTTGTPHQIATTNIPTLDYLQAGCPCTLLLCNQQCETNEHRLHSDF